MKVMPTQKCARGASNRASEFARMMADLFPSAGADQSRLTIPRGSRPPAHVLLVGDLGIAEIPGNQPLAVLPLKDLGAMAFATVALVGLAPRPKRRKNVRAA